VAALGGVPRPALSQHFAPKPSVAMSELNSVTLEYAKTRKQFGVALGTFQVLAAPHG